MVSITFIASRQNISWVEFLVMLPFNGLIDGACLLFLFKLSNNESMNKMNSPVSFASGTKPYLLFVSAMKN